MDTTPVTQVTQVIPVNPSLVLISLDAEADNLADAMGITDERANELAKLISAKLNELYGPQSTVVQQMEVASYFTANVAEFGFICFQIAHMQDAQRGDNHVD